MSIKSKLLWMKWSKMQESYKDLLDKHPDFSYNQALSLIREGKIAKPDEYSDERYAANLYSIKLSESL